MTAAAEALERQSQAMEQCVSFFWLGDALAEAPPGQPRSAAYLVRTDGKSAVPLAR